MDKPKMTEQADQVTAEERAAFLRRIGWRPDLPETERKAIEAEWEDSNIRMAVDLGF